MDEFQVAVDLGREALLMAAKLSLPLLLVGLIVGVIISILQAATQVQEQTLSLIPKIIAVVAVLFVIMPWMIQVIVEYTEELFINMARLFG